MPSTLKNHVDTFVAQCESTVQAEFNVPAEQVESQIVGGEPDYEKEAFCSVFVEAWVKDRKDTTLRSFTERFVAGGDATTHTLT